MYDPNNNINENGEYEHPVNSINSNTSTPVNDSTVNQQTTDQAAANQSADSCPASEWTSSSNQSQSSNYGRYVPPTEHRAPEVSGQYRYVRPDQQREPYSEANYTPVNESQNAVPRYCYAEKDNTKKQKPKKSGNGVGKFIAACLVCALIGGACGGFMGLKFGKPDSGEEASADTSAVVSADAGDISVSNSTAKQSTTTNTTKLTTKTSSGSELSAEDIYSQACEQVVGITSEITYTNAFGFTSSGAVSGSGFFISSDGYILTNYHVIETAVQGNYDITVMKNDGTSYTATVVGYEDDNDIAVLKVDAECSNPVTFADSDELMVGSTCYAVGNPLGELDYTMTSGMVSALDREITTSDSSTGTSNTINMFQIDAAVNSGNSGGPVYNANGEVIGIVTAKYSDSGVEGLGFAIPSNDAVYIANELITNGYVSGKAYFGISVGTLSSSARQYWGIPAGAYVDSVDEDSCASKAGLQAGDTITAIDDTEITSGNDLINAKKNYHAGDTATLTVSRAGQTLTLTITFDEEQATTATTNSAQQSGTQSDSQYGGQYGGSTIPGFGGNR